MDMFLKCNIKTEVLIQVLHTFLLFENKTQKILLLYDD